MYKVGPYYETALFEDNRKTTSRIITNSFTIQNNHIKNIKYDLNINENTNFSIGGVHGATANIILLNYDGLYTNTIFENKEFNIQLKINVDDLYTVNKFDKSLVSIINTLKIKHITSLWTPQGLFYAKKITKNEDKTITLELVDKTKILDTEYVCSLTPPFTLKQLYNDVHSYFQLSTSTTTFYNENQVIDSVPTGYTGKQIIGYIAECACGYYIINRDGNGVILTYGTDSVKTIEKGKYKKFLPAESYITIQKIKYNDSKIIGSSSGHVLVLDKDNPFINDAIAQNILLKMQGFTYITYTYIATDYDFAMDVCDKFNITNTSDVKYLTYIMKNSWEYNSAISQNWEATGETDFDNTYSSSGIGPINKSIERIFNESIPGVYEKAVNKATELITTFNGGYVVKKDGELYISDNEDIDKAKHIWRWNINGLGYSSTGINGPYGTAITMDGRIVADYISSGTMSADRINGGTLTIGGSNNASGIINVKNSDGINKITMDSDGIKMADGTSIIR